MASFGNAIDHHQIVILDCSLPQPGRHSEERKSGPVVETTKLLFEVIPRNDHGVIR